MAWRVCIHPGCKKSKPIQPFGTTTRHDWLCHKHRQALIDRRIAHIARVANAKLLIKIMVSRE